MSITSSDRWTCPDCHRTVAVYANEDDTRAALNAAQYRHSAGHNRPRPDLIQPPPAPRVPTSERKSLLWKPPLPPAAGHQFVTPRQADILGELCLGHDDPTIAKSLGLTETTVRHYIKLTLHAIGARNRMQAVALALSGAMTVTVIGPRQRKSAA